MHGPNKHHPNKHRLRMHASHLHLRKMHRRNRQRTRTAAPWTAQTERQRKPKGSATMHGRKYQQCEDPISGIPQE